MTRSSARTHETRALLLRRVGYAESDLIVTLMTERLGRVSALARAARKSKKRFGGSLEPMHTLMVTLDQRAGAELALLREARIEHARMRLVSDLDRLEAAGRALGWLRHAAPVDRPEPEAWRRIGELLDRLDDEARFEPARELAAHGLLLLDALGWALDFSRCVGCGRACPAGSSASIDPARGGLVCRACGGARIKLTSAARERLEAAAQGRPEALEPGDVVLTLEIVEAALSAHMGIEVGV